MSNKVVISEILTHGDLPKSGESLYQLMADAVNMGNVLQIDMSGAISLPTIFLNTSFGRMLEDYGYEVLKSHLSFVHITKSQAERISDYIRKFLDVEKQVSTIKTNI